jgi:hypothetical protein
LIFLIDFILPLVFNSFYGVSPNLMFFGAPVVPQIVSIEV